MKALSTFLLVSLVALAAASPAGAATSERAAEKALNRAERALRGELGPRAATLALRDLALKRHALRGAQLRRARALELRPTDPGGDGFTEYTVPEEPPVCSDAFCIHYVATTEDAPDPTDDLDAGLEPGANGVPDYVDEMLAEFDYTSVVEQAPAPAGLGWNDPVPDGTEGGGVDLFDVYITEFDGELYGYAQTEDPEDGTFQFPAYMVMDNDYSLDEFGYEDPTAPLEVTAAHEYNHVLQFAIDVRFDLWIGEAVATWMEDKVYPDVNDWQFYLPAWASAPEAPLDSGDAANGLKIYGSAVFMHYLSDRYGDRVIRDAFQLLPEVEPPMYSYAALDQAIAARGGISTSSDFAHMAAASAEWKAPGAGVHNGEDFVADVRRDGTLGPEQTVAPTLDHTGFALYDVQPSGNDTVKLEVTAPAGTSSALALVGRSGESVDTRITELPAGGTGSVTLSFADTYERVTAVIVNADTTASPDAEFDEDQGAFDWQYLRDGQAYSARLITDFVAPETVLVGGPVDGDLAGVQTFGFSADEDATFECSLDGAVYTACTSPASTPPLAAGLHTFAVRGTDGAGNVGFPARRDFLLAAAPADEDEEVLPVSAAVVRASVAAAGLDIKGALRRHGKRKLLNTDPKFSFDAPAGGTLVVRLAAGGKTIASTRTRLAQAREFKGRLRVTPKGERLLKKTKGKLAASLTVKFVPDDGADPETYTSKLTLRR